MGEPRCGTSPCSRCAVAAKRSGNSQKPGIRAWGGEGEGSGAAPSPGKRGQQQLVLMNYHRGVATLLQLPQQGGSRHWEATLGTPWAWGPGTQHQRGRLREQRGAGTHGRSPSREEQLPPAAASCAWRCRESPRGWGRRERSAPCSAPRQPPAAAWASGEPVGSTSPAPALSGCSRVSGTRLQSPNAAQLLRPQTQNQPPWVYFLDIFFVAGSSGIWGRRGKGGY